MSINGTGKLFQLIHTNAVSKAFSEIILILFSFYLSFFVCLKTSISPPPLQVKRGGDKKRDSAVLDESYIRSLEEAAEAFAEFQSNRGRIRDEESAERASKPSKYVKIKTNKPVGNVRVEVDKSSTPVCECDPNSKDPCG